MYAKVKPGSGELMNVTEIARTAKTSWHFAKKMTELKNFPKPTKIGKTNYWMRSEVTKYLKL